MLLKFLLYREVLKFWSNQAYGWKNVRAKHPSNLIDLQSFLCEEVKI